MSADVANAWEKLEEHYRGQHFNLRVLLNEPRRFEQFSLKLMLDAEKASTFLLLDYSKNLITKETLDLLFNLAKAANVEEWRDRMFSGDFINSTEQRAVLHTALRLPPGHSSGCNLFQAEVRGELEKMQRIACDIREGRFTGFTGSRVRNIVNIGIGGSDLGPAMVTEALEAYRGEESKLQFFFVSNIDGTQIYRLLEKLDAAETLFIIVSKTFTTQETLRNAQTAREWTLKCMHQVEAIKDHFIAISTNEAAVAKFGIETSSRMLRFWDWVGGRYSLWSAVGLSIMIAIRPEWFEELLAGAHAMDCHFKEAPLHSNMPVIMAILGIWYRNILHLPSHAILPYEQYLARFPAYLQQTDMESNGKSVRRDGSPVTRDTGPIIWGEPGTNGQHAFYQLLHQGTTVIPADFIVGLQPAFPLKDNNLLEHHKILLSNCLAQTEALARGKTATEVVQESKGSITSDLIPHKVFPGNRPSNTIIYHRLDPRTLGALIALYEHKVFVQGIIWEINSFDQWGVELGKQLAGVILSELSSSTTIQIKNQHDGATQDLLNFVKNNK